MHGPNNTHSTDQCRVLQSQAEKMSACYKAQDSSRKNKRPRYENKTWNRKNKEEKEQKKEETYAIVEAMVKKALSENKKSQELDDFNFDTVKSLTIDDIESGNDSSNE